MKRLIFLLAIACMFGLTAGAQTAPVNRGVYGTQSNYFSTQMHTTTPAGTTKNTNKDTLVNADSGFTYVWIGQGYDLSFEMTRTILTGAATTESDILYGYNNGGAPLTAAQVATVTGYAITGNTTYCAGCIGASYTSTVTGTTKRIWQVPKSAGALFDNFFIRTIQTGTVTGTYSVKVQTQY